MGTPSYMPPEQWMSATMADAKTDVYALGVMLYLMLAGRYPFIGDNVNQLMMKHMYEEAVPIRQIAPTVSAQTVALVDALLSKTQKSRPNMGEVSARIEKILPSISATAPSSAAPAKFVSEIQSAPTRYGDGEGPAAAAAGNPAVQATAIQGDIAAAPAGNLAWTNLQIDAADPTKMVPAAKMPAAVAEPRRAMPANRQAGGPSNPWIKYAVLGACILLALSLIVRLVR
jgi:serine/threonine-protein kinase